MPNRNGKGNPNGGRATARRSFANNARPQGSDNCTCPQCGHKEIHHRGMPCNQVKCPKCGALMTGEFC